MTQNQKIKRHLEKWGTITPIVALNQYGCFRLGARIYDLKKQGLDIRTVLEYKGRKKWARYYLKKEGIVKKIKDIFNFKIKKDAEI